MVCLSLCLLSVKVPPEELVSVKSGASCPTIGFPNISIPRTLPFCLQHNSKAAHYEQYRKAPALPDHDLYLQRFMIVLQCEFALSGKLALHLRKSAGTRCLGLYSPQEQGHTNRSELGSSREISGHAIAKYSRLMRAFASSSGRRRNRLSGPNCV